jgi:hypothetical protein
MLCQGPDRRLPWVIDAGGEVEEPLMSPQPGDVAANTVGADNLTPFAAPEILSLHGVTDEPRPRNWPLQLIVIPIIFLGVRTPSGIYPLPTLSAALAG